MTWKGLLSFVLPAAFLTVVWLGLADPSDMGEVSIGAACAIAAVAFAGGARRRLSEARLSHKTVLYGVPFLFVFFYELIKANIDVALRVVNPRLPLNPGIVKVRTRLASRIGRTVLANAITLTPGTLTVDIEGDLLYVHWIDITSADQEALTRQILGKFEKYLEAMFG